MLHISGRRCELGSQRCQMVFQPFALGLKSRQLLVEFDVLGFLLRSIFLTLLQLVMELLKLTFLRLKHHAHPTNNDNRNNKEWHDELL